MSIIPLLFLFLFIFYFLFLSFISLFLLIFFSSIHSYPFLHFCSHPFPCILWLWPPAHLPSSAPSLARMPPMASPPQARFHPPLCTATSSFLLPSYVRRRRPPLRWRHRGLILCALLLCCGLLFLHRPQRRRLLLLRSAGGAVRPWRPLFRTPAATTDHCLRGVVPRWTPPGDTTSKEAWRSGGSDLFHLPLLQIALESAYHRRFSLGAIFSPL